MRSPTLLALLLLGTACAVPTPRAEAPADLALKIGFDLDTIDADGLYGDAGGRRAMSYEFCIPKEPPELLETIRRIDPTAETSNSPGRIGCNETQRLIIGSTHQHDWRRVLGELASRPEIERIEPAWFE